MRKWMDCSKSPRSLHSFRDQWSGKWRVIEHALTKEFCFAVRAIFMIFINFESDPCGWIFGKTCSPYQLCIVLLNVSIDCLKICWSPSVSTLGLGVGMRFYIKFAQFEQRQREMERAQAGERKKPGYNVDLWPRGTWTQAIFKLALDILPKGATVAPLPPSVSRFWRGKKQIDLKRKLEHLSISTKICCFF